MFQNVIFQWILRRGMELGGLFGVLVTFYVNLPPSTQEALGRIFSRDWGSVTLGSIWPLGLALWGYIWSFRSTTKPHVTADNTQTSLNKLPPSTVTKVKVDASIAQQKPSTTPSFADLLKSIFQK